MNTVARRSHPSVISTSSHTMTQASNGVSNDGTRSNINYSLVPEASTPSSSSVSSSMGTSSKNLRCRTVSPGECTVSSSSSLTPEAVMPTTYSPQVLRRSWFRTHLTQPTRQLSSSQLPVLLKTHQFSQHRYNYHHYLHHRYQFCIHIKRVLPVRCHILATTLVFLCLFVLLRQSQHLEQEKIGDLKNFPLSWLTFAAKTGSTRQHPKSRIRRTFRDSASSWYASFISWLFPFWTAVNASRKYVHTFHSLDVEKRELLFVHIPKTGGTTMESVVAAHQGHLSWGICMMSHINDTVPRLLGCPMDLDSRRRRLDFAIDMPLWHAPTHYFPLDGSNPYQNADLFGIVRHPMARMMSEYHYVCRELPGHCEGVDMSQYFEGRLAELQQDYFYDSGHLIPQYDFVAGPNDVRYLDYVLQMDDQYLTMDFKGIDIGNGYHRSPDAVEMNVLKDGFARLAIAYRLPLAWPDQKINAGQYDRRSTLRQDVRRKLELHFAKDWWLLVPPAPDQPFPPFSSIPSYADDNNGVVRGTSTRNKH